MGTSVWLNIFINLVIATIAGYLFTPISTFLFKKLKKADLPSNLRSIADPLRDRKIHSKIYYRSGGIVVAIIFFGAVLLNFYNVSIAFTLSICTALIIISGLYDDIFGMPASLQFLFQFLVCLVLVKSGIVVDLNSSILSNYIDFNKFHLVVISIPEIFTILWLMLVMNAFNWIDGIDGLSTGITSIMSFLCIVFSLRVGNSFTAIVSSILAGATLGYLPHNFPNSKNTMVGFGATLFGFVIGVLSLLIPARSAVAMLLLIPTVDLLWVLINRILYHKKINPLEILKISDATHIHHRLLKIGFSSTQITLLFYCLTLFIGSIALINYGSTKAYIPLIILLFVIITFVLIEFIYRRYSIKVVKTDLFINSKNIGKYKITNNSLTFKFNQDLYSWQLNNFIYGLSKDMKNNSIEWKVNGNKNLQIIIELLNKNNIKILQ